MKSKILFTILFLLSIVIYAATIRGIPGNAPANLIKNNLDQATKPFELSPERGRYILLLSLANNHSFSLTKQLADAAFPDVGYYKGRFYVYFAPGISLLAWPFYAIGSNFDLGQVSAYAAITAFALLNIIVLYRISRDILKLPVWISLTVPLIFAFGSSSWSYAITMYQHHVTAFFIISSFYAIWKFRQRGRLSWLWALYVWIAYAGAIAIDYPNAVFMVPDLIYLAFSTFLVKETKDKVTLTVRMSTILTAFVFAALMVLHGYYNYANFGSPFRVSGSLIGYKTVLEQKLADTRKGEALLQNLQKKKNVSGFFQEYRIPFSPYTLLIGPDRGILLYAPIFLLAIVGIILSLKHLNAEINTLLGTLAAHFFLYSSWGDPWGGWAFGPRYMIPSMAVLVLFAGICLNKYGKSIWFRILTFALFAYSCAISLMGALTTNAVPPKIEADFLRMKYNFLMNYDFLRDGRSGSYVYNTFAAGTFTLDQYYMLIMIVVLTMVAAVLFVVPLLYRHEH